MRKRQTATLAKECNWAVTCILQKYNAGSEIWRLTVSDSHPLVPNPLIYIQHKRRHKDYQHAVAQAIDHRNAGLSYNTSLQLKATD